HSLPLFLHPCPTRRSSDLLLLLAALQGDAANFAISDFRFASGETLPVLRLHYRTLGRPERDARGVVRNAVLVLHGTGGSGSQFLDRKSTRLNSSHQIISYA